jgi:acetate kinase
VRILVVNAGSSSVKLDLLDDEDAVLHSCELPSPEGTVEPELLGSSIKNWGDVEAVGHRIVHGGTEFIEPIRLDQRVRSRLGALSDLAPLHQPRSLAALDAISELLPDVPAIACFDTAFHSTLPPSASTYALPSEWRTRWQLRRYGFHGLSHAYIAKRVGELVGADSRAVRVVSCHLGAGASLAAIDQGRSVDTTMGFTPLDGLVMATRSGSLDPGLILWLEEHAHTPPGALAMTLEHRSGLLGLAGSADMRVVLARSEEGDATAQLAIAVYVHSLRAGIASMTAAMGGLEVLAFTGGVGENASAVRALAASGLGFLGVKVDPTANSGAVVDCEISAADATVRTFVIGAREDRQIADEVRKVLSHR